MLCSIKTVGNFPSLAYTVIAFGSVLCDLGLLVVDVALDRVVRFSFMLDDILTIPVSGRS